MQLFSKPPDSLVIHHSGGNIAQTMEQIKKEHTSPSSSDPSKPWDDIGYHKVIEYPTLKTNVLADIIKAGRKEDYVGAHCLGFNSRSLGVCVVGDWRNLQPHPTQLQALIVVVSEWVHKYNIKPENIFCHKDKFNTACPGEALALVVEKLKKGLLDGPKPV